MSAKQKTRYILGWVFVRPRRWLFWKMIISYYPRWAIKKEDCFGWTFPNIHWWVFYKTAFKFFKWLYYDAWRPFCDWTGGYRRTYPWIARVIHRIGSTTAGYAISGGECFHCASEEWCQVELSDDETGEKFILGRTWETSTQDGTSYVFEGVIICPVCGYRSHYNDCS